jgi:hypothetical protein
MLEILCRDAREIGFRCLARRVLRLFRASARQQPYRSIGGWAPPRVLCTPLRASAALRRMALPGNQTDLGYRDVVEHVLLGRRSIFKSSSVSGVTLAIRYPWISAAVSATAD